MRIFSIAALVAVGLSLAGCMSNDRIGPLAVVWPDGSPQAYQQAVRRGPMVLDENLNNAGAIVNAIHAKEPRPAREAILADRLSTAWHMRQKNNPCQQRENLLVLPHDGGPGRYDVLIVCADSDTAYLHVLVGHALDYMGGEWGPNYSYDEQGPLPRRLVVTSTGVAKFVETPRQYNRWARTTEPWQNSDRSGCVGRTVRAYATLQSGKLTKQCAWAA